MRANWTEEQVELLKKYYPIRKTVDMLHMFPSYTQAQINGKAKQLKIKKTPEVLKETRLSASLESRKNREELVTDEEKKIIIQYYPSEGVRGVNRRLPKKRPPNTIKTIAYRYGIKRNNAKCDIWHLQSVEEKDEDAFSLEFNYEEL